MDVPELLLKEQLKREKLMRSIMAVRIRKLKKRAIPVAALESTEQNRVIDGCLRRGWKIRKLVSPNVRGWPDLFIMDPRSKRCVFMELKVKGRSHPVSQAQADTLAMLQSCGLRTAIAWGAEEALKILEENFNA